MDNLIKNNNPFKQIASPLTQVMQSNPSNTLCNPGFTRHRIPSDITEEDKIDAWLGDALLSYDVKRICVRNYGTIDQAWCASKTSNESLKLWIIQNAPELEKQYCLHGKNNHSYGTAFEAEYWNEISLRDQYTAQLLDGNNQIDPPSIEIHKYCWKDLFDEFPYKGNHPYRNLPVLTKGQLLSIARDNDFSKSKTFSVKETASNELHLFPGVDDPLTIVNSMSKNQKLGTLELYNFEREYARYIQTHEPNFVEYEEVTVEFDHIDEDCMFGAGETYDCTRKMFRDLLTDPIYSDPEEMRAMMWLRESMSLYKGTDSADGQNNYRAVEVSHDEDCPLFGLEHHPLARFEAYSAQKNIQEYILSGAFLDEEGETCNCDVETKFVTPEQPEFAMSWEAVRANLFDFQEVGVTHMYGFKHVDDCYFHFSKDYPMISIDEFNAMESTFTAYTKETIITNIYNYNFLDNVHASGMKHFNTTLARFGVNASYLLKSKFFEKLSIDNDSSRVYVEAVDSHDNRVVNNTFSSMHFKYLKTTRPTARLVDGKFRELDNIMVVSSEIGIEDNDKTFLLDVCHAYAFFNACEAPLNVNRKSLEILSKQDWFTYSNPDVASNLITMEPTINEVKNHNLTFVIGPMIGTDNEGFLPNDIGYYKYTRGVVQYSFENSTVVHTVGWWKKLLSGTNYFQKEGLVIRCVARKYFDGMQVMVITTLKDDRLISVLDDEREFDIPILAPNALWTTGIPLLTVKRVNLNRNLLNRLINKNLTGNVSHDLMMEYGMSLAWYSYNKRGVELSQHKIDPVDVKTHVYIANVLVRRQKLRDEIDNVLMVDGIPKLLLSLLTAILQVNFMDDLIPGHFLEILDKVKNVLGNPIIKSKSNVDLYNWLSIDTWTLKPTLTKVMTGDNMKCNHHKNCSRTTTGKLCSCCFSNTAEDSGLCSCCDVFHSCVHVCFMEHSGSKICSCCKKPTNTTICGCCTLKNMVPTTLEAKIESDAVSTLRRKPFTLGDKQVEIWEPSKPCVYIKGATHVHECPSCQKLYSHTHSPKNINTRHPTFVGDCPWCEDNEKSVKVTGDNQKVPGVKPQVKEDVLFVSHAGDKLDEFELEFTKSQLCEYLSANCVTQMIGEIPMTKLVSIPNKDLSTITYICSPHPLEPVANFEIELEKEVTITDCGVDCLKFFLKADFNEDIVRKISKNKRMVNFSSQQLINVLSHHGFNSCIGTSVGYQFVRVNQSESFATIIQASLGSRKDAVDHWEVAIISRVDSKLNQLWASPLHTPLEHDNMAKSNFGINYGSLTNKQKLLCAYRLASKLSASVAVDIQMPTVKNGKLSNSEYHEPRNARFNVDIPSYMVEILAGGFKCLETQTVNEEANQVYDMSLNQSADIKHNTKATIMDLLYNWSKVFNNPTSHCNTQLTQVNQHFDKHYINLPDRLKTGDVLFIQTGENIRPVIIKIEDGRCFLKLDQYKSGLRVMIGIPKMSFSSFLIRISALLSVTMSQDHLNNILSNSSAIKGFGGSGKTTDLTKNLIAVKDTVTFIACTSGGVSSLKEKTKQGDIIMSFEKATITNANTKIVVLDECTMVRPWELALILTNKVEQILMAGDPLQIGAIDMYASGGSRYNINCMDYMIEKGKCTVKTTTYRFGNPLVKELKLHPALADMESMCPYDTTVSLHHLRDFEVDTILLLTTGANVVLCFYNAHVELIKKMLLSQNRLTEVTTIHKYQGRETDKVVIIQAPFSNNADVHLALGHTVSAATRAKKHLIWVSIKCFEPTTNLAQRLGGHVGSFTPHKIVINEREVWEEDFLATIEKLKSMSYTKQNLDNFDPCSFIRIMSFYSGAVKLEDSKLIDDKLVLNFKSMGMKAQFTLNDKGEATNSMGIYTEELKQAVYASCLNKVQQFKSDQAMAIEGKGLYRIRIINWLIKVYEANNKILTLEGELEGYTVTTEGRHCAACGPVRFIAPDKVETIVNKDYLNSNSRTAKGRDVNLIVKVLSNNQPWDILPAELDDKNFSLTILTERFNLALRESYNKHSEFNHYFWYHRYENKILKSEINKTLQLEIDTTNYDDMSWYPFKTSYNIIGTKTSTFDGERRVVEKNLKKIKLLDLCYVALCNMHEHYKKKTLVKIAAKYYMSKIGAPNLLSTDRMTGMHEDIEWHKSNKTKTYFNLVDRFGKLGVSSLKYEHKLMFAPNEVANNIQSMFNYNRVASNNLPILDDSLVSACDIYFALSVMSSCKRKSIQLILSCSYTSFVINADNCKTSNNFGAPTNDALKALQSNTFNTMIKAKMAHTSAEEEEYEHLKNHLEGRESKFVGWNSMASIYASGPEVFKLTLDQIEQFVTSGKEMLFWAPLNHFDMRGNHVLKLEGSNSHYELSDEWYNSLFKGEPLQLVTTSVMVHLLKYEGQIGFFSMQQLATNLWMSPWLDNDRYVTLEVPKLILDPTIAISENTLLTTELKRLNINFISNMRRRCLRPGTRFEDLLVHARTLVNTVQFSTTTVANKYDISVNEAYDCAKLAWLIHENENKMLSLVSNSNSILDDAKGGVLLVLANAMKKWLPSASVNSMLQKITSNSDSKLITVMNKFLYNLELLKPIVLKPSKQIKGGADLYWPSLKHKVFRTFMDGKIDVNTIPTFLFTVHKDCLNCFKSGIYLIGPSLGKKFDFDDEVTHNMDYDANRVVCLKASNCDYESDHEVKSITLSSKAVKDSFINCNFANSPCSSTTIRLIPTFDLENNFCNETLDLVNEQQIMNLCTSNTSFINCLINFKTTTLPCEEIVMRCFNCTINIQKPVSSLVSNKNTFLVKRMNQLSTDPGQNGTQPFSVRSLKRDVFNMRRVLQHNVKVIEKTMILLNGKIVVRTTPQQLLQNINKHSIKPSDLPHFKNLDLPIPLMSTTDDQFFCTELGIVQKSDAGCVLGSMFNYYVPKTWGEPTVFEFDGLLYEYGEVMKLEHITDVMIGKPLVSKHGFKVFDSVFYFHGDIIPEVMLQGNEINASPILQKPEDTYKRNYYTHVCEECQAYHVWPCKMFAILCENLHVMKVMTSPSGTKEGAIMIPTQAKILDALLLADFIIPEAEDEKREEKQEHSTDEQVDEDWKEVVESFDVDDENSQGFREPPIVGNNADNLKLMQENIKNHIDVLSKMIERPEQLDRYNLELKGQTDDFLRSLLDIEPDSRFDLPEELQQELSFFTGEQMEVKPSPFFTGRLKLGRDVKSSRYHWVDEGLARGALLTPTAQDFIATFRKKVLALNSLITDEWSVSSLFRGYAERGLPVVGNRHINIGLKDDYFESLGFETLQLNKDPGRFGACLRFLFVCCLPAFASCHIISGRPSVHCYYAEAVTKMLIDNPTYQTENVNFVVLPWKNVGPFLDGMTIGKQISSASLAWYAACNLNYWQVYGIDECNIDWFELDLVYNFAQSTNNYSNFSLHGGKNHKEIKTVTLDAGNFVVPLIPYKFVQGSTKDHAKYQAYTVYLDEHALTSDTRHPERITAVDEEVKLEMEKLRIQLKQREGKFDLKILEQPFTKIDPVYYSIPNDEPALVYNPTNPDSCFSACLFFYFSVTKIKYNRTQVASSLRLRPFMTEDNIKNVLNVLDINYSIRGSNEDIMVKRNDSDKWLHLQYVNREMGAGHVVVVKYQHLEVESIQIRIIKESHLAYMNDDQFKLAIETQEKFEQAYLTGNGQGMFKTSDIKNLQHRMRGRVANIMERNNGIISLDKLIISEKLKLVNVPAGKVLLMRTKDNWVPVISQEIKGKTYIFTELIGNTEAINPGVFVEYIQPQTNENIKLQPVTRPKPNTRILLSKNEIGFATAKDKEFAMDISHRLASHPVNIKADVLCISNFDNREHHMSTLRGEVLKRIPQNLRIISKDDLANYDIMEGLKYDGPFRMAIQAGTPIITHLVVGGQKGVDYAKWCSKMCNEFNINNPNDARKIHEIAKAWGKIKFREVGNDLMPQPDLFVEKFYTLGNEGLIEGELINQIVLESIGVTLNLSGQYKIHYEEVSRRADLVGLARSFATHDTYWNSSSLMFVNYFKTGTGFIDYTLQTTDAVKIDENVLDNFNTIDALGRAKPAIEYGKLSDSVIQNIDSLWGLNNLVVSEKPDPLLSECEIDEQNGILVGFSGTSNPITEDHNIPIIPATVMNYWDDETGMLDQNMPLPNKDLKFQMTSDFSGIKTSIKTSMTQYPSHSQPAYTKRAGAVMQATTELFGKVLTLRQVEHDPKADALMFAKTYFKKGSAAALPAVGLDTEEIKKWLSNRPDYVKISDDLEDILSSGLDVRGLDRVNIHAKLESRMKDVLTLEIEDNGMPNTLEEQRMRLIVWQRKGITAIFAPFFKELKENLKRVLRKDVIYVDGLTPQQISSELNKISSKNVLFAEDDLKKQDRQTDETLIATEMEIYKLLGGNSSIINLWKYVHKQWRAKGMGVKFTGNAMRHTGQATTALGNAIVNLVVKMRVVQDLGKKLQLMLVLGDDNIIVTKPPITPEQITLNSARHFNMQSEASVDSVQGGFLRMVVFKSSDGNLQCGPDFVRLRRRYEVTNGVNEANDDNIIARTMSYCSMLGNLKPVRDLVNKNAWPLELSNWYDYLGLVNALAHKYKCSEEFIEGELNNLIHSMDERKVYHHEKLIFTSADH